jgi:hypothetical protein
VLLVRSASYRWHGQETEAGSFRAYPERPRETTEDSRVLAGFPMQKGSSHGDSHDPLRYQFNETLARVPLLRSGEQPQLVSNNDFAEG